MAHRAISVYPPGADTYVYAAAGTACFGAQHYATFGYGGPPHSCAPDHANTGLPEAGDVSAARSLQQMVASGLMGASWFEQVLYPQGDSHGTDIFLGPNGPDATRRILEFLAVHSRG